MVATVLRWLGVALVGAFAATWVWPRTGAPEVVLPLAITLGVVGHVLVRRVLPVAAGPLGTAAVLIGLAAWSPALRDTPMGNAGHAASVGAVLLVGTAVAALVWWRVPQPGVRLAAAALVASAVLTAGWVAVEPRLYYRTEDVGWRSGAQALAGRLHLPAEDGPHPLVVLIGGSGPNTRDQGRAHADALARRGFAVLTYDKRGSGGSTGGSPHDPYPALAGDVLAGIGALALRGDVDTRRVGLWGHSEGSWVAVQAADVDRRIDWLVLVSGGGVSPGATIEYQRGLEMAEAGLGADEIDAVWTLRRAINDYYRTGEGRAEVEQRIRVAQAQPWWSTAARSVALPGPDEVPRAGSPEAEEWLAMWDFPSVDRLARLGLPVLSVHGGRDRQDPPGEAAAAMRSLVAGLDDGVSEVLVHPEAGHAIEVRAFGQGWLPPWYADGYLERVTDWAAARAAEAG